MEIGSFMIDGGELRGPLNVAGCWITTVEGVRDFSGGSGGRTRLHTIGKQITTDCK